MRHWWDARQGCDTYIGHALRKYGREAFEWKVVATFVDVCTAKQAEKLAIAEGYGHFNLSPGGDWNPGPCAEARLRMSLASKGKPKSAETVRRMSDAQRGHKVTAEARLNMSRAKRSSMSDETCAKISAAHKGKKKPYVIEHARQMGLSRKGKPGTMTGKKLSAEALAKMKASLTGRELSPEHKANVSKAVTAWWKQRKLNNELRGMAPDVIPIEV